MSNNKLVCIVSPHVGDMEQNIRFAKVAYRCVTEQGATPIVVHLLYPQLLDDGIHAEREVGSQVGSRVSEACDESWVCGTHISKGMETEISAAGQMGVPVCKLPNISLGIPEQSYVMAMGC